MKKLVNFSVALLSLILMFASCDGTKISNGDSSKENIVVSVNINAEEGQPAEGFLWENNFSEITITGYIGASNDLVIPEKINGKPVTLIKPDAFKNFSGLKSLKIPGSVKTLSKAFKNCTSLEELVIGAGVEDISSAFTECTSLKTVSIPGSVKNASGAFAGCTSLQSATVGEGVINMSGTFFNCLELISVSLPSTVTEMEETFAFCEKLESGNIPASVTNCKNAFLDCHSLKTAEIGEGVPLLDRTFKNCTSLSSIVIPASVKSADSAFSNCTALSSVSLSDGIESLHGTFQNCTSLISVVVPSTVKKATYGFENCTSLTSVSLSEGIESLSYTFENCTSLVKVIIPESVNFMDGTFLGCSSLKSLKIPENASVFSSVWENCINLEELTIPQSYDYGFSSSLTELKELRVLNGPERCVSWIIDCDTDYKTYVYEGNGEDWYRNFMSADLSSYRYYTGSIKTDDGKYYYQIAEDANGNHIESHFVETESASKRYMLCIRDKKAAVLCEEENYFYYVSIDSYNDQRSEILINGVAYPVITPDYEGEPTTELPSVADPVYPTEDTTSTTDFENRWY